MSDGGAKLFLKLQEDKLKVGIALIPLDLDGGVAAEHTIPADGPKRKHSSYTAVVQ